MNHKDELDKLKSGYRAQLLTLQEALASDTTMLLKARGKPFLNPAFFSQRSQCQGKRFFSATRHKAY